MREIENNKLFIKNQFILIGEDILPEEYPNFKSFLKEVKLQEMQQIILTKQ